MLNRLIDAGMWGITFFMFVLLVVAGASMDSENIILPSVCVLISLGWLLWFSNAWWYE